MKSYKMESSVKSSILKKESKITSKKDGSGSRVSVTELDVGIALEEKGTGNISDVEEQKVKRGHFIRCFK